MIDLRVLNVAGNEVIFTLGIKEMTVYLNSILNLNVNSETSRCYISYKNVVKVFLSKENTRIAIDRLSDRLYIYLRNPESSDDLFRTFKKEMKDFLRIYKTIQEINKKEKNLIKKYEGKEEYV